MKRTIHSNSPLTRDGRKRFGSSHRGAVLVEAALVTVTIVIPLLLGIMQFGLFYFAKNALKQATRAGARYAAVYGIAVGKTDADIKNRVVETGKAGNIIIDPNNISISPTNRTSGDQYKPITITVTYNLNAKSILPYRPGTVSSTSTTLLE